MLLLDNQTCFALYAASRSMTKVYQPLLKKLGLTYPQYLVLLILWEKDGVTVSELGDRLDLDSGTLTPLLKRMESSKFLNRDRSLTDEREVRISLTTLGRALRTQALSIPEKVICASRCSRTELSALTRKLNELRKSLQVAGLESDQK